MSDTNKIKDEELLKSCPDAIHLMFDEDNLYDENDEFKLFDQHDHEYTYWGQGESNASTDVNYIRKDIADHQTSRQSKEIEELKKELEIAKDLIRRMDNILEQAYSFESDVRDFLTK